MKLKSKNINDMELHNSCDSCGNCSRCGGCCSMMIPISKEEEKRIRKYIQENNIKKEQLFKNNDFYATCCFYDRQNKKCKIYEARPEICKTYQCNRKKAELIYERDENQKKAYWNQIDNTGKLKNVTTFDLLFYDDPVPLITILLHEFGNTDTGFEKMIRFLEDSGQKELANSMTPIYGE